jgi:hypothetical protein
MPLMWRHATCPITCSDVSMTSLHAKHTASGMWRCNKFSHTKSLQLAACLKVKLKRRKLPGHEDVFGNGGTAPCILNRCTAWSYMGQITGRPLEARRHCQDGGLERGWVGPTADLDVAGCRIKIENACIYVCVKLSVRRDFRGWIAYV